MVASVKVTVVDWGQRDFPPLVVKRNSKEFSCHVLACFQHCGEEMEAGESFPFKEAWIYRYFTQTFGKVS